MGRYTLKDVTEIPESHQVGIQTGVGPVQQLVMDFFDSGKKFQEVIVEGIKPESAATSIQAAIRKLDLRDEVKVVQRKAENGILRVFMVNPRKLSVKEGSRFRSTRN